jgi:hypothetical protein
LCSSSGPLMVMPEMSFARFILEEVC